VDLGVHGLVELPGRLRIATGLGVMPGFYVDLINEVAEGFGWYGPEDAALIRAALDQSLIWRTTVGWRPFRKIGWYVSAGYTLAALGGSTSIEEIAVEAGVQPGADHAPDREYDLAATVHFATFETGYEWFFTRNFYFLGGVGFMATFAASTSMEPKFQPLAPRINAEFRNRVETYLQDLFTSYVHTPTVTLAVGYRFP
jgi:hypothetical protein